MDPFTYVANGNVEYFREASLEVISNTRDECGYNLLHIAVRQQDLNCVKVLYERCPELLYSGSHQDVNPFHDAAARDDVEILKLFINADKERQARGDERRLTRIPDSWGHAALMTAIKFNKPEAVKLLYAADPDFHHPLHDKSQTPLNFCMSKSNMEEMFKLLLEIAPTQSKTRLRPKGWTILHYGASNGDLRSVEDILHFCPDCSEVVDDVGQNFLHVATQHEQVEVVRFCIEEINDVPSDVINGKDNDGNTPLSIAVTTENESITLCLLSDPRVKIELAAVSRHLHWTVRRSNLRIVKHVVDASPDFLNGIETDLLRDSRDIDGESILSKAIQEGDLDLCRMICNRCPLLVYRQSKNGKTPLHQAVERGNVNMVDLLINSGAEANVENKGDIESQVDINLNTKLLMMVDEQGDTALHTAVSNHKLKAAKLLIEAGPEIVYTTNNAGETPLSIAIKEAQTHQNKLDTGKIRKLLLKMQPSQYTKRRSEDGWTLLHFVARHDDSSAVVDFINLRSDWLNLVDNEGMNFLHIAAKFKSTQVVKHVLGDPKVPDMVLNLQDNTGHTPLHLAILSGDESLARCFLYNIRVEKNTANNNGQTVLKAINFDYDKRRAGVHGSLDQVDQKDMKDQSDFDLVVGALIATVSFTAGITIPGGYISDGPNRGTAVLAHKIAFEAFIISNTFALLFSLYAVFSHYCTRRLVKDQDTIYQLKVATNCTLGAIYAMMAAFISGSFTVLENSTGLAIVVCAICSCFYIFSFRPMWKIRMQERGRSHTGGQSGSEESH